MFDLYHIILYSLAPSMNVCAKELILFVLRLFGLFMFEEVGSGRTNIIEQLSKGFYTSQFDKDPSGILIGKDYAGYICREDTWERGCRSYGYKLRIICSLSRWEELNKSLSPNDFNSSITVIRDLQLATVAQDKANPWMPQRKLIDKILSIYDAKKYISVYLYGNAGSGKSKIGIILSQMTGGYLCTDMDISSTDKHDGNGIIGVYRKAKPTFKRPLIVLLDEIDTILFTINDMTQARKATNKKTWNKFWDNIDNGMFPYTIFIMTSNMAKQEADAIDNSLLRNGRINLCCKLSKMDAEFIDGVDCEQQTPSYIS